MRDAYECKKGVYRNIFQGGGIWGHISILAITIIAYNYIEMYILYYLRFATQRFQHKARQYISFPPSRIYPRACLKPAIIARVCPNNSRHPLLDTDEKTGTHTRYFTCYLLPVHLISCSYTRTHTCTHTHLLSLTI